MSRSIVTYLIIVILLFSTWYIVIRVNIWCYNSVFNTPDTWHLISDTDTWHVFTWHLMSDTSTWHVITWYLIPDTWYMTLVNWHAITYLTCFHMTLVHLTWCCDTWLDTIIPGTCITLHIYDYHFYEDLAWLLYYYQTFGTPELLCSWTPVFLNPCNREAPDIILLILYSCWSL